MSDGEIGIKRFAEVVRRFCSWAENLADPNEKELDVAHRLLCELQLNVLDLPDLESESTDHSLGRNDWLNVYERFQHLPINFYCKVYDVFSEDEVPVGCAISDDLSDIYRDLKEGLLLYDSGKVNEAVWEWRFNYLIHWGRHLTGVQTALHQYLSYIRI